MPRCKLVDRWCGRRLVASFQIPPGTELGFFIVPNNTVTTFLSSPGDFYPPATSPDALCAPHFSNENANPGEFDQFLSFVGDGITHFTFEDLTRIGESDEDFTDMAFTIDAELRPVDPGGEIPEPGRAVLGLAGLAAGGLVRRRPAKR